MRGSYVFGLPQLQFEVVICQCFKQHCYGDIQRTHFHVLKSEQQILMDWVSFDNKFNWKNDLIIEKFSQKNTENFGKIK